MINGINSFDVLSRDLSILGSRLLEASAGTGKTFAIEHLVVRLILERNEKFALEQILALTFTRAATRELKTRIRANLEAALVQLQGGSPKFDYLVAIVEEGEERLEEARRRLEDALSTFDQAQIFTIHSFCFRMLKEFAFEANLPFNLVDPEEGEAAERRVACIYDFFRTGLKPPLYGMSQIAGLLKEVKSDFGELARRLKPLIERGGSSDPLKTFPESHALFNRQLLALAPLAQENLLSDFQKLAPHYKGISLEEMERQCAQFASFAHKKMCTEEEFDTLLGYKTWFLEPLHEGNLKKRAALPPASALFYPGIFKELRERFLQLVEHARDPLHTLMRAAKECAQKVGGDALSFDGLLHKMHETLKNPVFCDRIRNKYKALIVDEFQDTDPIQWQIFRTLFIAEAGCLCIYLVGDPKQSIYGFRGADVYTYLEAAASVKERVHLNTNFRSKPPLVNALNRLFSEAAHWLPLPAQESALSYHPVKNKGGDESGFQDGKEAVHFFIGQGESGRERSWPTSRMERELFFPFIASEIERLHGQQNLPFHSFAVLIKDRFQAERLQEFLKGWNIPAALSRGKSILDSKGFPAMEQLLEALIDPSKIKRLLAGPLFGLSEHEFKEAETGEIKAVLKELAERASAKGFASLMPAVFALVWKGKSVLQRMSETPELSYEFRQVAELLMQEEAKRGGSLQGLLLFMNRLKRDRAHTEEAALVRTAAASDAVALMTVHMSKGLEFDVVFALGLVWRHAQKEELIFIREDKKERVQKLNLDEISSLLYLKEKDAEKMRQLYVALTRAKSRVYIPLAFQKEEGEIYDLGEGAPVELFFSKQGASKITLEESLAFLERVKEGASISYSRLEGQIPTPVIHEQDSLFCAPLSRSYKIPENPRSLLSFSSLAKKTEGEPILQDKSLPTLPIGAETGTVLHEILEKIFKKKLFVASKRQERNSLITHELSRTHLKEWQDDVLTLLNSALALPLEDSQGPFTLEDLLPHAVAQEMEFLFPVKNDLIKGFADLFFEREGKYYLVDWKSNFLGEEKDSYTQENLKKAMQAHDYFLQASIYACAFERYVKLFDKRPFEEIFGGAYYFFLRGKTAYHFIPDRYKI